MAVVVITKVITSLLIDLFANRVTLLILLCTPDSDWLESHLFVILAYSLITSLKKFTNQNLLSRVNQKGYCVCKKVYFYIPGDANRIIRLSNYSKFIEVNRTIKIRLSNSIEGNRIFTFYSWLIRLNSITFTIRLSSIVFDCCFIQEKMFRHSTLCFFSALSTFSMKKIMAPITSATFTRRLGSGGRRVFVGDFEKNFRAKHFSRASWKSMRKMI